MCPSSPDDSRALSRLRCLGWPLVFATLATGWILTHRAPCGRDAAAVGPGLTLDETFNVRQGLYLVRAVRDYGLGLATPESIQEVFGDRQFLADHPPLGRFALGLAHEMAQTAAGADADPARVNIGDARIATAIAFGLLVALVGTVTGRWYGNFAGAIAALALVLMPRAFGHAHLAALETFIGLTWTATVLYVAAQWVTPDGRVPGNRVAALAGMWLGLALLTKIQAVLIPIPLALWSGYHWRTAAWRPLSICGVVAAVVFFAGWPWLWLDPVDHTLEYLARTTGRTPLKVWYFGQVFWDTQVPWHYPFVMFAATLPLASFVLGVIGLLRAGKPGQTPVSSGGSEAAPDTHGPKTPQSSNRTSRPREQFLLLCLAFPLIVFALPGTAVYDGVRLFLVVFPLWAVLVGAGAEAVRSCFRRSRTAAGLLLLLLSAQLLGLLRVQPCYLSYYSTAVGGLAGADRLGLERTYWGDSLLGPFLGASATAVPVGSRVDVFPVLHPQPLLELQTQCTAFEARQIQLRPLSEEHWDDVRYILLFRRQADLPPELRRGPPGSVLTEVVCEGVQLAALYEVDPSTLRLSDNMGGD